MDVSGTIEKVGRQKTGNKKVELFGLPVWAESRKALVSHIEKGLLASSAERFGIIALNALKVCQFTDGLIPRERMRDSKYVVIPDGISVVHAATVLSRKVHELVAGVDLMFNLLALAQKYQLSVYFLGSPQNLLDKVVHTIPQKYPDARIAGHQHGYYEAHEEEKVIAKIAQAAPDILFIAFGSPRKENFIIENMDRLRVRVCLGVGGSYEVLVGEKKRGPKWRQSIGLEWVNRLAQDPLRLWKRYLTTNSRFLWLFLKEFSRNKS